MQNIVSPVSALGLKEAIFKAISKDFSLPLLTEYVLP